MPDLSSAAWRKSSFSNGGTDCVEVARLADGSTAVRDSKDPDGAVLTFTPSEIAAFVQGCQAGEFDDLTR